MVVVWLAEQDKPVKRRVALKLIKSELASKEVLARFDAEKQARTMMDQGHESSICCVAFDPDSKRFVSGSFDQAVKLWHIESGEVITRLTGLTGRVNGLAFSPDRTRVPVCDDLTIKLWDPQSGRVVKSLDGHGRAVLDVAFNPDGSQIYSESKNEKMIWDLATKKREPDAA